jgi:hypothetical protein
LRWRLSPEGRRAEGTMATTFDHQEWKAVLAMARREFAAPSRNGALLLAAAILDFEAARKGGAALPTCAYYSPTPPPIARRPAHACERVATTEIDGARVCAACKREILREAELLAVSSD